MVSLVFWPGHMNLDTIGELTDARYQHYTDWHSSIWSALWHQLIVIGLGDPGWMLVGGALTLLTGLYLLLRVGLPRPVALMGAALVFVFPPVLGFDIEIGTDAWFASTILCAFGFAARCARTRGWPQAVSAAGAVAFAFLCQAARPTAAPAILALFFGLAIVVLAPRLRGWRRLFSAAGIGIATTALIAGSIIGLQRAVLHAWEAHPEQITYDYDLVAMSIAEHRVLLPPDSYPLQDLAYLERWVGASGGTDISPLLFGPHATIPVIVQGKAFTALQEAWLTAIRQHPGDYLSVRWHTALWHLTIAGPATFPYYPGPVQGYGFGFLHPGLHQRAMLYAGAGTTSYLVGGWLQTVWVYVLLLIAGTVAAAVAALRGHRGYLVLALAGVAMLLYTVEILFLTPGVTYRYMYPPVTTGTLFFVLMTTGAAGWLWSSLRRLGARGRRGSQPDPMMLEEVRPGRGPAGEVATLGHLAGVLGNREEAPVEDGTV
jgi:hypothetical protein